MEEHKEIFTDTTASSELRRGLRCNVRHESGGSGKEGIKKGDVSVRITGKTFEEVCHLRERLSE